MTDATEPDVVYLNDPRAVDPRLVGAKAANLARAAVGGLPILPGFALTTRSFDPEVVGNPAMPLDPTAEAALMAAWARLAEAGGEPLVVRSSSTIEDIGESSMAGQFTSLLDVKGPDGFLAAVRAVLASARTATPGEPPLPMAVLVQSQLDAARGGVMFGIDPVSGDPHRIAVEVVPGGPDKLVSGTVTAASYHLRRDGRLMDRDDGGGAPLIDARQRRELAKLARRTGEVFGCPQDIEWAHDRGGKLWLLQSRPVTASGELHTATGPILGPGPVGETFPDPLTQLEEDLWLPPLREGIVSALRVTGAVSENRIRRSPVVVTVGRRIACDLELLGATPVRQSTWRWLDPRQPARRVLAAWRIGRLRAVLPRMVRDAIGRVDAMLAELPALPDLTDQQLVDVILRARLVLGSVHGHEVLTGTLLAVDEAGATGAGMALEGVSIGRCNGLTDGQIVSRNPVVLALLPPRIGQHPALPPVTIADGGAADRGLAGLDELSPREGMRLRARWLQELTARAAFELGLRLQRDGRLANAHDVATLSLEEVVRLVSEPESGVPAVGEPAAAGPPLPAAFRLTAGGGIAPIRQKGYHRGGRGAGGGRGEGPVVHGTAGLIPEQGSVMVVRNLEPNLAAALPRLNGLVAETGSSLSHLAILAREYGVPTVVAVADALHRFPEGSMLVVDGDTGEVTEQAGRPPITEASPSGVAAS